eukprot:530525-Pelagomonas_calceolata.AAC.1
MLDENVSPAADQPESRAVGCPPCNPLHICSLTSPQITILPCLFSGSRQKERKKDYACQVRPCALRK